MGAASRLLLAALAGAATYYFVYWVPLAFMPIFGRTMEHVVSMACGVLLAAIVWWAAGPDARRARPVILRSALVGAGVFFALGFVGPMVLVPGANQGPLLGFFTGPLGFLAGALYGLVRALGRVDEE